MDIKQTYFKLKHNLEVAETQMRQFQEYAIGRCDHPLCKFSERVVEDAGKFFVITMNKCKICGAEFDTQKKIEEK